jgi:hypothetical protein
MNKDDAGIWVVVDVRSGIPVNVDAFTDEKSAIVCQEKLQTQINPESDEVGLFYVQTFNKPIIAVA